ncbi:hypothetical protein V2J09_001739 [Rumex salicifolius]
MLYHIFFTILLLQTHDCFASRGLGFVRHARLFNQEQSSSYEDLKTSSGSSNEAKQVIVHMQMASKQIKPSEILQGTIGKDVFMGKPQNERSEDDLEEASGDVIDAKDYVRSRGKSPIHNHH